MPLTWKGQEVSQPGQSRRSTLLPVLQIYPNEANKSEACQHASPVSVHEYVFSLTDLMLAFQGLFL